MSFGSLATKGCSEYLRHVLGPGEMRLDRGRAGGGGAPGYVHEHGEDERARLARTGLGDADHVLRGPQKTTQCNERKGEAPSDHVPVVVDLS